MRHKVACHQSLGMHMNIANGFSIISEKRCEWRIHRICSCCACNCLQTILQCNRQPQLNRTNTVSPVLVPAHCRKRTYILPSYLHVRALIPLFPELHGMPLSLQRHVHPSDLCKPEHSLCTSLRL